MTFADPTRSGWGESPQPASGVVGCCEQCGLGYEVLAVDLGGDEVVCRDCGGPVYALDAVVELAGVADDDPLAVEEDPFCCSECIALELLCPWHRGWAAGWDAACRVTAEFSPAVLFDQDDEVQGDTEAIDAREAGESAA